MLKALLLFFCLFVTVSAQAQYNKYCDKNFNFCLKYPADFKPSMNDSTRGKSFEHPDGTIINGYGFNSSNKNIKDRYKKRVNELTNIVSDTTIQDIQYNLAWETTDRMFFEIAILWQKKYKVLWVSTPKTNRDKYKEAFNVLRKEFTYSAIH